MSQTIYGVPGSFCWAELFTNNDSKSKDFYAHLFSWTYSQCPMPDGTEYNHATISDGAVGGIMQINEDMKKQGMVPHWNAYIAVNDVDATIKTAIKFGAEVVMPAMDVPNAGRMAFIKDPTGAHISLWQSNNPDKKSAPRNAHGMVGWNELMTTDAQKAKQFYTNVFGWETVAEEFNGKSYISYTLGGLFVAGMMEIGPEMGPMPSCWALYFTTNNLELSRRLAKDLGASELSPVIDLPNIGKLVVIKDPQDATFSLFEWANK